MQYLQNKALTLLKLKNSVTTKVGNFFKDDSDHRTKALKLEEQVLALAGLELNTDVFIYDVAVNFDGENYIHTVECGRDNKEILILLHGFSGSIAYLSPLLKDLSTKFRVFCIDLLGMGLSSRPEFKCNSCDETAEYYANSCEEWRKAMQIEECYIGGHSFGGYIAPIWAHKYKKGVKGLYLMSPNGTTAMSDESISDEWEKALGAINVIGWNLYFKVHKWLYKYRVTPQGLVRTFKIFSKLFVKRYMKVLCEENQEIGELLGEYEYEMLSIPGGGEQAVHYVLSSPRLSTPSPLDIHVFPYMKDIPVYCYFGEVDWNDWTVVRKLTEDPVYKNFKVEIIQKAGHQMTMQNPSEVTEKILVTLDTVVIPQAVAC